MSESTATSDASKDVPAREDQPDAGGDQPDAWPGSSRRKPDPGYQPFQQAPILTREEFESERYKMDYPKRGIAIIINNKTFGRHLSLGERTGTDRDAAALNNRFTELGFDVTLRHNLGVKEMGMLLTEAAASDHGQYDCFMCAILSHGEEGVVYGVDDKVELKQLIEPFKGSKCQSLAGKPKIFIIQACQGYQFDEGVGLTVADAKGEAPMDEGEVTVHRIPSEADFLICYSVVPGYYSWRNSTNGSWFVQALSQVLEKYGDRMELMRMMTIVNRIVAYDFESNTNKQSMNEKKQIPCITSMLTKEVYFQPK